MTIKEAQDTVDQWIRSYGIRYFNELTNLAILTEEVGEVARVMVREFGEQSPKENERMYDLSEELGDVLFVLICIANQTGIDLSVALKESIDKKTSRDKSRHFLNKKLK